MAAALGVSKSTARRRLEEHEARLLKDGAYAELCASVVRQATRIEYRPPIVEPVFCVPGDE
jgi:hypothetical protein